MNADTTQHRHVDAAYAFPVEERDDSPPMPNEVIPVLDLDGTETDYPIVQARAGNITPRVSGSAEAATAGGSTTSAPTHLLLSGKSSTASGVGNSPGRKSAPRAKAPGSAGGGSSRNSPAFHSIVAYVHGPNRGGKNAGGSANDSDADDNRETNLHAGGNVVEGTPEEFRLNSKPFSSILTHSRHRLSTSSGAAAAGGVAGLTGAAGNVNSARTTPQLMYRQDCVEEVARMSPVASAANSPYNTPRVQSRRTSAAFHAGGAATASGHDEMHKAGSSLTAGRGSLSTTPAGTPPPPVVGVSTPEMAEYFSDTAVHLGANYRSEKTVNSTFVMQKCLKTMQEQARAIHALQTELQLMQNRNRLLEKRVLSLELGTMAVQPQSTTAKCDQGKAQARGHREAEAVPEERPSDVGRGSGSPSVNRPSDTLSDEHCSTRAPSKAV